MEDVTQMLGAVSDGDRKVWDHLLEAVYEPLRSLAERQFRREAQSHTLQPTAIAHEAFLRLVRQDQVNWRNRSHFFAIASQQIRRILVDHARSKDRRRKLQAELPPATSITVGGMNYDLLALDDALQSLAAVDSIGAKVVEMRFFAGETHEEIATVLGVNEKTIRRHWNFAKAWLRRELNRGCSTAEESS